MIQSDPITSCIAVIYHTALESTGPDLNQKDALGGYMLIISQLSCLWPRDWEGPRSRTPSLNSVICAFLTIFGNIC